MSKGYVGINSDVELVNVSFQCYENGELINVSLEGAVSKKDEMVEQAYKRGAVTFHMSGTFKRGGSCPDCNESTDIRFTHKNHKGEFLCKKCSFKRDLKAARKMTLSF